MNAEKKARGWAAYLIVLSGIGIFLSIATAVFIEEWWPYIHGATPAEIARQSLERTPQQLAHDLPSTTLSSHDTQVTVRFKVSAGRPYQDAVFKWSAQELDGPNAIELHVEHGSTHGPEVITALDHTLHHVYDSGYRWGGVQFNVGKKDGSISFSVNPMNGLDTNPLFERQMEAARDVMLNAAFGLPLKVSDQEIADVLGSGVRTIDVGKIDPATPIENARALVVKLCPSALDSRSSKFTIPLDHPIIGAVELVWANEPRGRLQSIALTELRAYMNNRTTLQTCLETKLGPPTINVTNYVAGEKDFTFAIGSLALRMSSHSLDVESHEAIDAASFAKLFAAFDGCRDSTENTARSHGDAKPRK